MILQCQIKHNSVFFLEIIYILLIIKTKTKKIKIKNTKKFTIIYVKFDLKFLILEFNLITLSSFPFEQEELIHSLSFCGINTGPDFDIDGTAVWFTFDGEFVFIVT